MRPRGPTVLALQPGKETNDIGRAYNRQGALQRRDAGICLHGSAPLAIDLAKLNVLTGGGREDWAGVLCEEIA